VARDPESAALGVAVQSRYFNVGHVVPWAEAGVGAIATQAFSDPGYGPRALESLRAGSPAPETLKTLVAQDPQREVRQVAVVDARGAVAVHTGSACVVHADHRIGDGYAVQGNMLASEGVCEAMDRAYARARGVFPQRLVAALEAGQRAGGDARGMQSAALLVVRAAAPEQPWLGRWIDLRVEDHRKPIAELGRLLRLRLAYDAIDRAHRALAAGRLEEGRAEVDRALRLSRRHDEILFWAGMGLERAGQREEAVELLRAALRRNRRWRTMLERLPPGLRPSEDTQRRLRRRRDRD
jgi:uncharacterized Ntn-hydrolase superfamily protein